MIPSHPTLSTFATEAHALAREKGWYDDPRTWRELVSLTQGEFHEAIAELRHGRAVTDITTASGVPVRLDTYDPARDGKLTGFLVELADVVVRALDAVTWHGYAPTMAPAMTPSGHARARLETAKDLCERLSLSMSEDMRARDLGIVAWECLEWSHANGLDLWGVVLAKHAYNRTRPRKHGKVF